MTISALPSAATPQQALGALAAISIESAQAVIVGAPNLQRTVGLQILLARTPSHVARILPRSRSAAENTTSFLFGS